MRYMGVNEIREKFLSFFESKGHLRLPSASLVPTDDKSLLLINSGMAPLKKYFSGELTPPQKRMTTCQKCFRTPDIDRVGKTSRHGTYFEMLGNFSFGDYFKKEATKWAWEFVTEVMEIPVDKLWVSIYLDDDEAFEIWTKEVGVSPDRMVRLGKADNFWEIGTGPCGPCSEIYIDRGAQYGCNDPKCAVGCDCDRYVEFWNLVFTQFDSDGKGNYTRLAKPNIDTGMGLERLACIMQSVNNLFEIDTVKNIMTNISKHAGITYGEDKKKDVSLRIITDHIRGITFMIGDGILPSNESRGYVVRRLLRRAARHGKLLNINKPFLFEVCDTVIKENISAYPELNEKKDYIKRVIKTEEERFALTLDQGLAMLKEMTADLKNKTVMSGDDAFKLYDTFGFPFDLTCDILAEQNISVDEERFNILMEEQKERARDARVTLGDNAWKADLNITKDFAKTTFAGYEKDECSSKIIGIIAEDEKQEAIFEGQKAAIILDISPFYAESGGQVGDTGTIQNGKNIFNVEDTQKTAEGIYLHYGTLKAGELKVSGAVKAITDTERRNAIKRNHSSLHLLQAALRKVVGSHVEQAGSYVDNERGRFDFTHFTNLSDEEITSVENLVNEKILEGLKITVREMPVADAKKEGAIALFGEKYGETVRVVKMGDFSTELCGGTHLDNTAKAGLFKIISEVSVAAGVRRIECLTGMNIFNLLIQKEILINQTAQVLKSNPADILRRAEQITAELKSAQKEVESLNSKIASSKSTDLLSNAKDLGGVRFLAVKLENISLDALRTMGDTIKEKAKDIVALFAVVLDDKINFLAVCGSDAVSHGANAGAIVREVAKIAGGGGGGRADSASAGGKDISKLKEALDAAEGIVKNMLK